MRVPSIFDPQFSILVPPSVCDFSGETAFREQKHPVIQWKSGARGLKTLILSVISCAVAAGRSCDHRGTAMEAVRMIGSTLVSGPEVIDDLIGSRPG